MLLKANHKERKFQGNTVKRGQLITGLFSLSEETSLSVQQLRTSLKKLKSTNEITIESSSKNSLITIVNYDNYQVVEDEQQAEQQTSNKPSTKEQQTINNKQEYKELKKERIKEDNDISDSGEKVSPTPKKKKTIEERKQSFKESISKYKDQYSSELLNDFWKYWTEMNENGNQMKFEKQKTFGVGHRLATWKKNESKFNNGKTDKRSTRHEPAKDIVSYGKL